jgi:SAM-dependent methyltransferase
VAERPTYRTDLYRGTAGYYDRFRPPYPDQLTSDLLARVEVGAGDRLLDLACGTGQVAFALAEHFDEIWAVDQEAESVGFARAKAEALGIYKIHWLVGRAEDVAVTGPFDLVAVGNAFHRLHRETVAARAMSWLGPGRCLALLWGGTPWRGAGRWQAEMSAVLDEWVHRVDAADRVPADWEKGLARDPTPQLLERAGFTYLGEFAFAAEHTWTVETLVGFVYSTSFLNTEALGNHVQEFEEELAQRLLTHEPVGVFPQTIRFAYELARRPV